jgi:RHH-type proline utilization regulon transcriptional repressor/proline dehydrogenase/delta 1-pyrroline-5-carboxylate dehydrogenase
MIVDSTALPEQAVRDIIASAFQSAGQRCSALRCLYVQEDIAGQLPEMLFGAMDEAALGDPWDSRTDIGPVIDAEAQADIAAYVDAAAAEGRLLHRSPRRGGHFVGPCADPRARHRRPGARGLRPRPARGDLQGARTSTR